MAEIHPMYMYMQLYRRAQRHVCVNVVKLLYIHVHACTCTNVYRIQLHHVTVLHQSHAAPEQSGVCLSPSPPLPSPPLPSPSLQSSERLGSLEHSLRGVAAEGDSGQLQQQLTRLKKVMGYCVHQFVMVPI